MKRDLKDKQIPSKLTLTETETGFDLNVEYETTDDLLQMLAYLRAYTVEIYKELSVKQYMEAKGKTR